MTLAWIIISTILGVIWLIAFVGVTGVAVVDKIDSGHPFDWDAYRIFSAIMAGALIFVFAHWIVLLLVIPCFFLYGLWQGVRLLWTRPWKKPVKENLR